MEDGLAHGEDEDGGAELDALGEPGDVHERGQGLEEVDGGADADGAALGVWAAARLAVAVEDDVVGDPEGVEAGFFGGAGEGRDAVGRGGSDVGDVETDLHGASFLDREVAPP